MDPGKTNSNLNKEKRKRRNDILLLAGLLAAGVILFAGFSAAGSGSGQVIVIVGGQAVESFSLDENSEQMLEFNGRNLLVIEDGFASVEYADCPDKLCVKQRKINKDGETIICLPHKLIIKINE